MPPLDPEMPEEAMPPEQPEAAPYDSAPEGNPLEGGIVEASPEEQAMADRFVARAWELIYDDNTFPDIIEMLRGGAAEGGNPMQGLAQATDIIVARIGQAAEQAGQQLQSDPVMHAFGDIFEELAEVSRRAKIKDYAQDRDAFEGAYFQALDLYRARLDKAGVIDKESHQQGLQYLMEADQNGTLDRLMRELAESDASGQAGGEELPPEEEKPRRPKAKGMGTALGAPPAVKEELVRRTV